MTNVTFTGSTDGRSIGTVFCNSGQKNWEFPLGVQVDDVPETIIKKLQEDEYYSGYEFDVSSKKKANETGGSN